MTNVDVVIVSWAKNDNLHQVTKKGIDSLLKSESNIRFHIYVVESNPDTKYDEYNQNEFGHTCRTIHPEDKTFGYHKYLNLGRKQGDSKYVVLCNNDLTYESEWASKIVEQMEQKPYILSASPWCPQTQGANTQVLDKKIFFGHNVRGELAGWCIFQKREIYETIGDLDEEFTCWYCDNDYGMTLLSKGIIHALVVESVVNHHEKTIGKTIESYEGDKIRDITVLQGHKFEKKWRKVQA
jgi:GT2 family glycosyltransferase